MVHSIVCPKRGAAPRDFDPLPDEAEQSKRYKPSVTEALSSVIMQQRSRPGRHEPAQEGAVPGPRGDVVDVKQAAKDPVWDLLKPFLCQVQKSHCDPLDSAVELNSAIKYWNALQHTINELLVSLGADDREFWEELQRTTAIMETRISARSTLRAAGFAETPTLTWEKDTFKQGVLRGKCRARRLLVKAATFLEALRAIISDQQLMLLCSEKKELILLPADIVHAWQLRHVGKDDDIGPHPLSGAVPGDKAAKYWRLLMVEVNWDMHKAAVRHIWKAHTRIEERIAHLTDAINQISDLHAWMHQFLPARFHVLVKTKPLVIWLTPEWI
jgi:hypothetical protein